MRGGESRHISLLAGSSCCCAASTWVPLGTLRYVPVWITLAQENPHCLLGLPSHLEPYFADLKRCLEPAACALALCIYEMACGFELDGLPPVVPPTCPRSVREALDEMFRGPQRATSSSPREKRAACFTLEDCRSLPLFSGSVGPAVALEWEPLPSDMVKVALEVAKSTAAST